MFSKAFLFQISNKIMQKKPTENKQEERHFAPRHDYEISNFKRLDVAYLKIIQLHYRAICCAQHTLFIPALSGSTSENIKYLL